jgi:hypothetical protein
MTDLLKKVKKCLKGSNLVVLHFNAYEDYLTITQRGFNSSSGRCPVVAEVNIATSKVTINMKSLVDSTDSYKVLYDLEKMLVN